jgi:hypothetical protein
MPRWDWAPPMWIEKATACTEWCHIKIMFVKTKLVKIIHLSNFHSFLKYSLKEVNLLACVSYVA